MVPRRGSELVRLAPVLGLLLLGGAEPAAATTCPAAPSCAPVVLWPPDGADLPVNPLLVVDGCDELELALARPVLEGAGDPVPLRLVERLAGSSLAFEPALLLHPATHYRLVFHRLPDEVEFRSPSWTTLDSTDTTPPAWGGSPRVANPESTIDPGGSVSLALDLPIGDEPRGLALLVQVAREPRGMAAIERPRWLALEVSGTAVRARIPGGECTPWPGLSDSGPHSARLVLLDFAGNRSPARIVRFQVPPRPSPRGTGLALTAIEGAGFVRSKVEPVYTEAALEAQLSGIVAGWLLVDGDGAVVRVAVDRGLPIGLEEAAVKALYQWRFHPSSQPERRLSFETHFLIVPSAFDPDWNLD